MATAVSSIYDYQISAARAAYAPTNTAEVTAMIDSAVSGKLDASASSSFQPVGDYVSSSELSNYQTTAGMSAYQPSGDYATTGELAEKLDASASSSFVTSTADCMPLSSSSDFYPTGNPDGYLTSVDLTPYQTTAGMSAYATTGELAEKLDASASSSFITSTAGLATTSDLENYQPTSSMGAYATTADLSEKLDASASSSFITSTADCQPSGDYVSSSDLSSYLPTSSIGVDSASAVTSIAGSSIASGEQVVTSIATGGYGVSAINGRGINASHMVFGAAAENSSNSVKLGDSSYGAGVYLTGSFGTAYYKVNELQLNRNGTGFIGFNIGGAGSQITATSNAGGKFSAGGGKQSYFTAYNTSASASIEVTGDSAKVNLTDSGYTSTIYPSSVPYWNNKLDASAIETSVDGITGIAGTAIDAGATYSAGQYIQISGDEISVTGIDPNSYASTADLSAKLDTSASSSFQPVGNYVSSDELSAYQTVEGMSAYATTGELAEKLDASASSSFITSTSDCMPLSSSSEFYSTSNPSSFITGVDLTPYAESSSLSAYQQTSSMSAYATTGDLSAKMDSSAIQMVSASSEATANGVIYIVTGST